MFGPAVAADGTSVMRLEWNAQLRKPQPPQPQREFGTHKAPATYRIFIVGESSAEGVPYGTTLAFSSWLARRLAAQASEARWEIVNAALAGSQSWSELIVVRDAARYEPDLLVVYLGHNEIGTHFSSRGHRSLTALRLALQTSLGRLNLYHFLLGFVPTAMQTRLHIDPRDLDRPEEAFAIPRAGSERVYATAADRALAAELYRRRLVEMVRTMRQAGARTMLLTLSENFSEFPPVRSVHRTGMRADEKAAWRRDEREGRTLAPHDCAAALARWARAEAIDGGFAALEYEMATCERELGRLDAARARYRLASDLDRLSQGAPTSLNDVVREVATREGATLVDVDAAFVAASGPRLVGYDLFVDSHHPNVRGHQIIAAALAEAIRAQGEPLPATAWRIDAWVDPDRDAIVAANPEVPAQEAMCRFVSCAVARRPCLLDALEEAMRVTHDPATHKAAEDAMTAFRPYVASTPRAPR